MAVKSVTFFLFIDMSWIDKILKREAVVSEVKTQTAVGADYKENVEWVHTPTKAMKIAAGHLRGM